MTDKTVWIKPYVPRPCSPCVHRVRTWGMAHCALNKWDSIKDEKPCEDMTRVSDQTPPDSPSHPDAPAAA